MLKLKSVLKSINLWNHKCWKNPWTWKYWKTNHFDNLWSWKYWNTNHFDFKKDARRKMIEFGGGFAPRSLIWDRFRPKTKTVKVIIWWPGNQIFQISIWIPERIHTETVILCCNWNKIPKQWIMISNRRAPQTWWNLAAVSRRDLSYETDSGPETKTVKVIFW